MYYVDQTNNMLLLNNLHDSEKNVTLGGAWTLTSHSLGKCPNHLDYQLYMLLTVLNSPLRAYWSGPRDQTNKLSTMYYIYIVDVVIYLLHVFCFWRWWI